MIDTVTLTQPLPRRLSDLNLRAIGATRPRGKTCYKINPTHGERFPSLTFETHAGTMYLSASFSVPGVLYGHNSQLPNQTEVYQALNRVANLIGYGTGIDFNPVTANVVRVDYSRDFKLSEDRVVPTLQILSKVRISRRRPDKKGDTALYWQAKQSQICVYSKWHEAEDDYSKGILRLEYRFTDSDAIERKRKSMKLQDRTPISVLSADVSEKILDLAMYELQLTDALRGAEPDHALKRLCEHYKRTRAWRLYGFLKDLETYGEHFYRMPWLNVKKATYFRNLNECRKAGVWTSNCFE
jgi:hypothetical protein